MRKAVAAIVGQRYAAVAVVALRVGHSRRPIAGVALRHSSAGREGEGCNHKDRRNGPDVSSHFATSDWESKISLRALKHNRARPSYLSSECKTIVKALRAGANCRKHDYAQ